MAIALALLADCPQVSAVTVTKNLDAMVEAVGNYKVALRIERNAAVSVDLPRTAAPAANAADMGAIYIKNLNATVVETIVHDDVAVAVNGDTGGTK